MNNTAVKAKILLVEDNPMDVYLLRRALTEAQMDLDFTVIDDGAEALALIRKQGKYSDVPIPDLAILDLNLPKHDGLEVLEAMRASAGFGQVPVVILTSSLSRRDQLRAEGFRIRQYITKPLNFEGFLQVAAKLKALLAGGPLASPVD